MTLHLPVSRGVCDIQSIIRQRAEHALVHNVQGVKRVFVVEKDNHLMLRAEGVNILVGASCFLASS